MDSLVQSPSGRKPLLEFGAVFLLLFVVISALMHESFEPGQTLFSSDGPPGRLLAACHQLPQAFTGVWEDLYSVGYREQGAVPNVTYFLRYALGPMMFSKFYAPLALLFLGLAAWVFFRACGLSVPACILGGLAAALNTEFFSTACWGVAAHPLAIGMTFLALAALQNTAGWRGWVRLALAGCAIGMAVADGADVGAILSLYVSAYVLYQAVIVGSNKVKNTIVGVGKIAMIAVFAAFIAAQAISALVNTQIEGVVGMHQDEKTREERWDWATEWSLPKAEVLSMVVPGLFGYRIDTPAGGNYWGHIGRNPSWERYFANGQQGPKPRGLIRQTGGGVYTGLTVVLIACWAIAQSFRRNDSVFTTDRRRWLWFWLVVIVISLMLGFGRFAPFYQFVYRLPYFSTIRNPVKFVTLANFSFVVLFGFGVDGLWRKYMEPIRALAGRAATAIKFDRSWLWGCAAVWVLCLIGWGIFASSQSELQEYLRGEMFRDPLPRLTAAFSVVQVGWFVFFLAVAIIVQALILKGRFSGKTAKWGVISLGLLLILDLWRADSYYVVYWDVPQKYASNPVLDILRDKPYEHRVAQLPFTPPPNVTLLGDLYKFEWEQHQIPAFDIQSLDLVQMPRFPEDMAAFMKATSFKGDTNATIKLLRYWQLTNTRYLLGPVGYLDVINRDVDPTQHRFRVVTRFSVTQRQFDSLSARRLEHVSVELNPAGDYALFEFTGALPRAKLYSNWIINSNNAEVLDLITSTNFHPTRLVTVAGGVPAPTYNPDTNREAGTVEITHYAPKDIVLKADAAMPSILLLNDRYEPNWKVSVDGKPATLLRCNFLMRGVYLEAGPHTVEFQFKPGDRGLYVSLAGVGFALLLVGIISIPERNKNKTVLPVSLSEKVTAQSPPKPLPVSQNNAPAVPAPAAAPTLERPKPSTSKKEKRRAGKNK